MGSEVWKPVPGWHRYEASSHGRVRNVETGTVRVPTWNPRWLGPQLCLGKDGRRRTFFVHQLVALAFHGPCPPKHEINHIDNDRANSRPENLEYVTHKGNMEHAARQGRMARGERARTARLTEVQVREIRATYQKYSATHGAPALARRYGMSDQQIYTIVHGRQWSWLV